MGLFDFLRRKTAGGPRAAHYAMAHHALRRFALEDPVFYLGALASPDAGKFLASVFEVARKEATAGGEKPDFTAADVRPYPCRIADFPTIIVAMPPAKFTAEAHFTALVLLATAAVTTVEEAKAVEARYFTLEAGFALDDRPRTVFCEWTKDGKHLNFGDGPSATVEAFGARVHKAVAQAKPSGNGSPA